MGFGRNLTVAALAGATGTGKSSLFNKLSGSDLSPTGVLRPTTSTAQAAMWGEASDVLDWLGISRRHGLSDPDLDGLVLLDLPDHDSTQAEHRLEADRLVNLVDVFIWVVDPQKYADATLHDDYLQPLAGHAAVTVVVLNQIDRLSEAERRQCAADLARLLKADGMNGVRVLSTSAVTGEGLEDLRKTIVNRVREERASVERLSADLDRLAARLAPLCASAKAPGLTAGDRESLVDALAEAAGVETVAGAVARAHRRDAALAMGWPFTRWLRRFRPDPLRRLHLGRGGEGGRTSLPAATPLQRAQADGAVRRTAAAAGVGAAGTLAGRHQAIGRRIDRNPAGRAGRLDLPNRPAGVGPAGMVERSQRAADSAGGGSDSGVFVAGAAVRSGVAADPQTSDAGGGEHSLADPCSGGGTARRLRAQFHIPASGPGGRRTPAQTGIPGAALRREGDRRENRDRPYRAGDRPAPRILCGAGSAETDPLNRHRPGDVSPAGGSG